MLLIGHWDAPAVSRLRASLSSDTIAIDIPAAQALIQSGACHPDRVVVWQSIPHEYPAGDVQELIGTLPLAHWMAICGPWCESIGRTEGLWPAGWCVPLRTALTRLNSRRLLPNGTYFERNGASHRCCGGDFLGEKPAASALPLTKVSAIGLAPAAGDHDQAPVPATVSRDEAFALLTEWSRTDLQEHRRRVLIQGDDAAWSDCVTDIIRAAGFLGPDDENPDLVLLLGTQVDETLRRRVLISRKRFPLAQLLIVSDLARTCDEPALRAAGADAILSALYFAEEFQDALSC